MVDDYVWDNDEQFFEREREDEYSPTAFNIIFLSIQYIFSLSFVYM